MLFDLVYYKPFVGWIWGGCLLMALGGALAVLDRRYRAARRTAAAPVPNAASLQQPALALKALP